MLSRTLPLITLMVAHAFAAKGSGWQIPEAKPAPTLPVGDDGKYTIEAEGIRAQFIPYGASLTNLFIKDKNGIERDIVLGYDNATYYAKDPAHPHLGGVPGRYANRIKNSSFEIEGANFKVPANENNGADTLHGGPNGWDYRQFEVAQHTGDMIVFKIIDPDGSEGFPGTVTSYIHYRVSPYRWHLYMNATTTKTTPIMLTSHVYWNLDGFQNPNSQTALNHTLSLPFSGQRVDVDGILIPSGNILSNKNGSVNDFWSKPKQIGASFSDPAIKGNCGTNCDGYDNCYIVQREQLSAPYFHQSANGTQWWEADPVATLSSDWSGITVDIYSEQSAFQMYSCNGQNGTMPIKKTQGFFNDAKKPRVVEKYGCVVMEVQDWIDGINNPEWLRDTKQIITPTSEPYELEAMYSFEIKKA